MRRFDPASLFLLGISFPNLFDPTGDPGSFRCKGCGEQVRINQREDHYLEHKNDKTLAKSGGSKYPATDKTESGSESPKEDGMATTKTRTRSGSKSKTATARKTGTAMKTAAAKKTTPAKAKTSTGRVQAGEYVEAAAAFLKGKKPMAASAIAKALCDKNPGWVPYNVAFAIYKAEREGKVFKRTNDRPGLFKLKG